MALPPAVSIADADAYFVTTPRNAEWVAVTDKEVWLNEAYRLLTAICYDPSRDCCGRSFADAWTAANSELALALSRLPRSLLTQCAEVGRSVARLPQAGQGRSYSTAMWSRKKQNALQTT